MSDLVGTQNCCFSRAQAHLTHFLIHLGYSAYGTTSTTRPNITAGSGGIMIYGGTSTNRDGTPPLTSPEVSRPRDTTATSYPAGSSYMLFSGPYATGPMPNALSEIPNTGSMSPAHPTAPGISQPRDNTATSYPAGSSYMYFSGTYTTGPIPNTESEIPNTGSMSPAPPTAPRVSQPRETTVTSYPAGSSYMYVYGSYTTGPMYVTGSYFPTGPTYTMGNTYPTVSYYTLGSSYRTVTASYYTLGGSYTAETTAEATTAEYETTPTEEATTTPNDLDATNKPPEETTTDELTAIIKEAEKNPDDKNAEMTYPSSTSSKLVFTSTTPMSTTTISNFGPYPDSSGNKLYRNTIIFYALCNVLSIAVYFI